MPYDIHTARARIAHLREQIEHHRKLYYENDAPEISDFAFDALFEELKSLEAEFPELDRPDSPSHRVGGSVSAKFAEVKHVVPMGSLTDVFDFDALRAFIEGAKQTLRDAGETEIRFTVEEKFMQARSLSLLSVATTPEEVLDQLSVTADPVDIKETKFV